MLEIIWIATFKDGSAIQQYEPENKNLDIRDWQKLGKEHPFKEVLDRQDDLVYFTLVHTSVDVCYVVDLTNGCMFTKRKSELLLDPRADMLRKQSYKYRLIYFREVTRHFNQHLQELQSPEYIYFLGFQYTDENNKNHKRIAKISPDGRMVIN